jgi:hypothetical protein
MADDAEEYILEKIVRIDAWRDSPREERPERRRKVLPQ